MVRTVEIRNNRVTYFVNTELEHAFCRPVGSGRVGRARPKFCSYFSAGHSIETQYVC